MLWAASRSRSGMLRAASRGTILTGGRITHAPRPRLLCASGPKTAIVTRPPLAVRASLVGSAVALGTPLFAASGVAVFWVRGVQSLGPGMRMLVYTVVGGGLGTLMLSHVRPLLMYHSEVVLPFAVANGVSAAAWFLVLEATVGLEAMSGEIALAKALARTPGLLNTLPQAVAKWAVPLGGPLIGVLTAGTAGFLWAPLAEVLWPDDLKRALSGGAQVDGSLDLGWLLDAHFELLTFVSLPVGLLAGYGVHGLLAPVVLGQLPGPPRPWTATALPVLGLLTAASSWYFTRCGHYDSRQLFWEQRMEPTTGQPVAYNPRSGDRAPTKQVVAVREASKMVQGLARFLREPWWAFYLGLWATDARDQEKSLADKALVKFPLDDRKLPLHKLGDHEQLHLMIDMLVRLKGLQLGKYGNGAVPTDAADVASVEERQLADEFGLALDGTDVAGEDDASDRAVRFAARIKQRFGVDLLRLLDHAEMTIRVESSARGARAAGVDAPAQRKLADEVQALRNEMFRIKDLQSGFVSRVRTGDGDMCQSPQQVERFSKGMVCLLSRNLGWLRLRLEKELDYAPHEDERVISRVQDRRTSDTLWWVAHRATAAGLVLGACTWLVGGLRK